MNRYLIAAIYVMAGCVVTIPSGVCRGSIPVGTDSYRLLISANEKGSVHVDKKMADEFFKVLVENHNFPTSENTSENDFFSDPVYSVHSTTGVKANPIRAPGEYRI